MRIAVLMIVLLLPVAGCSEDTRAECAWWDGSKEWVCEVDGQQVVPVWHVSTDREPVIHEGQPVVHCRTYRDAQLGVVMEGPGCNKHLLPACYERMQEAMRLADAYFNKNLITAAVRSNDSKRDFLASVPWWNATMRDCVKGK